MQDASQGSLFDAFGQVPDAGAAFPGAGDLTHSGSVSEPYAGNSRRDSETCLRDRERFLGLAEWCMTPIGILRMRARRETG